MLALVSIFILVMSMQPLTMKINGWVSFLCGRCEREQRVSGHRQSGAVRNRWRDVTLSFLPQIAYFLLLITHKYWRRVRRGE